MDVQTNPQSFTFDRSHEFAQALQVLKDVATDVMLEGMSPTFNTHERLGRAIDKANELLRGDMPPTITKAAPADPQGKENGQ